MAPTCSHSTSPLVSPVHSALTHTAMLTSIIHSYVEQTMVKMVLKVQLRSCSGKIFVHLTPPPTDRLWCVKNACSPSSCLNAPYLTGAISLSSKSLVNTRTRLCGAEYLSPIVLGPFCDRGWPLYSPCISSYAHRDRRMYPEFPPSSSYQTALAESRPAQYRILLSRTGGGSSSSPRSISSSSRPRWACA